MGLFLKEAETLLPELIEIRRQIHRHPELGFETHRTSALAAAELKRLGFRVTEGVGRTGVVGDWVGKDPSRPFIVLRADMDALPMTEENEHGYCSQVPGAAHMCGHDAHTAMLIGAARLIQKFSKQLSANVRLVFQPNEENFPGGAPEMIRDGVLNQVSESYALHCWPLVPVGRVAVCRGPAMGSPEVFDIEVVGQGGHASAPHLARDPITAGAMVVAALRGLVERLNLSEPAVVQVTQFHGGTTHNVIPERIHIQGTSRVLRSETRDRLHSEIEAIVRAQCKVAGCEGKLTFGGGFPPTLNHEIAEKKVIQAAEKLLGHSQVDYPFPPSLAAEDFAYFGEQVPSCFVFLGTRNEARGLTRHCHDPRFDIDESALAIGAALLTQIVFDSV